MSGAARGAAAVTGSTSMAVRSCPQRLRSWSTRCAAPASSPTPLSVPWFRAGEWLPHDDQGGRRRTSPGCVQDGAIERHGLRFRMPRRPSRIGRHAGSTHRADRGRGDVARVSRHRRGHRVVGSRREAMSRAASARRNRRRRSPHRSRRRPSVARFCRVVLPERPAAAELLVEHVASAAPELHGRGSGAGRLRRCRSVRGCCHRARFLRRRRRELAIRSRRLQRQPAPPPGAGRAPAGGRLAAEGGRDVRRRDRRSAPTGLGKPGVRAVVVAGAPVLVLVSCDPVALARDAALLRLAWVPPRVDRRDRPLPAARTSRGGDAVHAARSSGQTAAVCCIRCSPTTSRAVADGRPVVALESTIFSNLGLPSPANAHALDRCRRRSGRGEAVPAVTAVLDGVARVGVPRRASADPRCRRARPPSATSPVAMAQRWEFGATTVSASLALAAAAGIAVFATGGIGGVHRGAGATGDVWPISTRSPTIRVVTVCAGAKAFLDLPRTLEYLETAGVPVLGWRHDEFPAFYTRSSGLPVPHRVESPRRSRPCSPHRTRDVRRAARRADPRATPRSTRPSSTR